jgi:hypothetical protein
MPIETELSGNARTSISLGLPPDTLARWKAGQPNQALGFLPEDISLLRPRVSTI